MFSASDAPEMNPPNPHRSLLMSLSYDYNMLPSQDLRSYWLCSQQHASADPTGIHPHQHLQALPPLPRPSLVVSPPPCLRWTQYSNALDSLSITEQRAQSFVPFTASHRASQGLTQPKPGKWGAMHVCIAWQIHRHKQRVEKSLMKPSEFPSVTDMAAAIQENRDSAHSSPPIPDGSHGRSTSLKRRASDCEGRTQPPLHLADLLRQEEEQTEEKETARAQPHTETSQHASRAAHGRASEYDAGPRRGSGDSRKRGPHESDGVRLKAMRMRHGEREDCRVFTGKMFQSAPVNGPQYYQPSPGYYATVGGMDPNTLYPTPSYSQGRFLQQNQHVFHQAVFMKQNTELQNLAGQSL
ncbi:uncharacterized protein LOC130406381 [Gadus chalcogrammus]|uniref:uncharacterized protein LOC130406381 n=1 Tax=Gadus chalcogrammus TaxID=1042646 RepID=UPI0024C4DB1D|nr:uncharacterized protein LOC130406381 [Gadus chalcogrammus]